MQAQLIIMILPHDSHFFFTLMYNFIKLYNIVKISVKEQQLVAMTYFKFIFFLRCDNVSAETQDCFC